MQTWSKNRIEIRPWHTIPEQMAALGLTNEDGMTKAWFVSADGQLIGGAEAINEAMRYVWWAKPVTYFYKLPGIRQLEDRVYEWIAKNRYRMPGSTAACAVPASPPLKTDPP